MECTKCADAARRQRDLEQRVEAVEAEKHAVARELDASREHWAHASAELTEQRGIGDELAAAADTKGREVAELLSRLDGEQATRAAARAELEAMAEEKRALEAQLHALSSTAEGEQSAWLQQLEAANTALAMAHAKNFEHEQEHLERVQTLQSALEESNGENRRMQQAQQSLREAQETLCSELDRMKEACSQGETRP